MAAKMAGSSACPRGRCLENHLCAAEERVARSLGSGTELMSASSVRSALKKARSWVVRRRGGGGGGGYRATLSFSLGGRRHAHATLIKGDVFCPPTYLLSS